MGVLPGEMDWKFRILGEGRSDNEVPQGKYYWKNKIDDLSIPRCMAIGCEKGGVWAPKEDPIVKTTTQAFAESSSKPRYSIVFIALIAAGAYMIFGGRKN